MAKLADIRNTIDAVLGKYEYGNDINVDITSSVINLDYPTYWDRHPNHVRAIIDTMIEVKDELEKIIDFKILIMGG